MLFIGMEMLIRCRWDRVPTIPPSLVMTMSFGSHRCDRRGAIDVCGDQSDFKALQPRTPSHLIEHGRNGAMLYGAAVGVQTEPFQSGLTTPGPIVG